MLNYTAYWSLNVHSGRINAYYQTTAPRRYLPPDPYEEGTDQNSTTKQPIQFQDNYHQGRISSTAKPKVSRAIEYLIYLAKPKLVRNPFNGKYFTFKVNFVTLSLSSKQIHTDQVIKSELLDQLIYEAKKRWNVDLYVWRAEKQKNGRIHFHILTDKFIPWNELRNVWNRIQGKLGYVAGYRKDRLEEHKHGFHYVPKYAEYWHHKNKPKAYKWDYNKQLILLRSLLKTRSIRKNRKGCLTTCRLKSNSRSGKKNLSPAVCGPVPRAWPIYLAVTWIFVQLWRKSSSVYFKTIINAFTTPIISMSTMLIKPRSGDLIACFSLHVLKTISGKSSPTGTFQLLHKTPG